MSYLVCVPYSKILINLVFCVENNLFFIPALLTIVDNEFFLLQTNQSNFRKKLKKDVNYPHNSHTFALLNIF